LAIVKKEKGGSHGGYPLSASSIQTKLQMAMAAAKASIALLVFGVIFITASGIRNTVSARYRRERFMRDT
jgi:hypothetical protein